MKRPLILVLVSVFVMAAAARAQEPAAEAAAAAPSPKSALAEQLVGVMEIQKTMDQMFAAMREQILQQSEQMARLVGKPGAGADAAQDSMQVVDLVQKEISWEKMKPRFVAMYADTFNEEELKGMLDFYRSPAGQAFVKKQPELTRRSMELNQQIMLEIMPKLQALKSPKAKPAQQPKVLAPAK